MEAEETNKSSLKSVPSDVVSPGGVAAELTQPSSEVLAGDPVPSSHEGESISSIEQKWTKALTRHGWIAFPSIIVERQHALGLDCTDLALLVHLARYWWEKERLPRPAVATLAGLMDRDRRTIQRRLKKLRDLKLISTVERKTKLGDNDTNEYDLTGLIREATALANAALKEKETAEKERVKKQRRGRARAASPGRAEENSDAE